MIHYFFQGWIICKELTNNVSVAINTCPNSTVRYCLLDCAIRVFLCKLSKLMYYSPFSRQICQVSLLLLHTVLRMPQCGSKIVKMMPECQTAWIRRRRQVFQLFIWIQAVCIWHSVVSGGLRVNPFQAIFPSSIFTTHCFWLNWFQVSGIHWFEILLHTYCFSTLSCFQWLQLWCGITQMNYHTWCNLGVILTACIYTWNIWYRATYMYIEPICGSLCENVLNLIPKWR